MCEYDNNAEEAKRAQTVGNKKNKKMEKKERRMRACRRPVRVKGCQIARTRTMKPLITINCIVWTASLYVYNILHIHTDLHNRNI